MKRTVFISHSSQDKKVADAVCSFLEKRGVYCWIAPRDITPGKNYGAAIIDAISECDFFVLILSRLSNDSQQVVREVERAASTQSVVIPLRIEAVEPSKDLQFYVGSSHWLDAITPPLDQHLMELLRAIQGWQKEEGQRRRRMPQPVENATTAATAPTAVPTAAPPKQRPVLWFLAMGLIAALAVLGVVLFLKSSSMRGPATDKSAALATPSSSAAAVQPSPPPIAVLNPKRDDPLEVLRAFPAEFLEKLGGHDVDAVLRHFAEPMNYYESAKVGHSFIRKDLERDDKTWPERSYSLTGEPKVTAAGNGYTVEFPMKYSLTNDRGTATGLLQMTMQVRLEHGVVVISDVQKRVVSAEKPGRR